MEITLKFALNLGGKLTEIFDLMIFFSCTCKVFFDRNEATFATF